ncbi:MAG TPA: hypothetical protein PKZ42_01685 [Syntrophales bacterium]|nr:hypothetical protein [Syntrophales bacterium]
MPIGYKTEEGTLIVYNVCTKCGRFLKFDDCEAFFHHEGYKFEIFGAVRAEGNCPRCGKVELDFEFM